MAKIGAGTALHNLIRDWTGEEPDFSCSCARWIRKMDRDLKWAKANVKVVVEKLRKEALKRKRRWKITPSGKWWVVAAMEVPGSQVVLRPFLRAMVRKAIAIAEGQDG